jgi:hypothetical protein
LPLIKEKFKKINIIINVREFDNNEFATEILNGRYCRIILKHDIKTQKFFEINNIDENYHMILNNSFNKKKKLNDIYATIVINNIIYQIIFSKI